MWCLPRMAAKLRCTCRFRSPRQAGSASAASAAIVRDAGAPPSRQASPACTSLLPCCVRPLHPTPRPTPFPPSPAFAAFACLAQRCPPPQLPLTHTTTPHPRPRPGPRHVVALQKTLWRGFIEKGTFDSSLEAAHQFKEMVRGGEGPHADRVTESGRWGGAAGPIQHDLVHERPCMVGTAAVFLTDGLMAAPCLWSC